MFINLLHINCTLYLCYNCSLSLTVHLKLVGILSGWDFVHWDFVCWDFVRWDFVLHSNNHKQSWQLTAFSNPPLYSQPDNNTHPGHPLFGDCLTCPRSFYLDTTVRVNNPLHCNVTFPDTSANHLCLKESHYPPLPVSEPVTLLHCYIVTLPSQVCQSTRNCV